MEPHYILTISEDASESLREEIATTNSVTPLWEARIFSQLVVDIHTNESRVAAGLRELDDVEHVVKERIGCENEMQIEHPADFIAQPSFDVDEETERVVNEELANVTGTHPSLNFDNLTVEEFEHQRIGVIDSGIEVRNPQVTNVVKRIKFTENDTFDDIGHGTVMACILNIQRPNSDLVDLKVLGDGTIRESDVIRAFAEATDPSHSIDAVSMSLGFVPRDADEYCPLCDAANRTFHAGTPVTASSGQLAAPMEKSVPPMCPARAEHVVAVTAESDRDSDDWFAEGDVMAKSDWVLTF